MEKKILNIVVAVLCVSAFIACGEWTEVERKNYYKPHGEEYYANLRAYKTSDHQVTFGWFGNWTGKGASLQGSLMGLPDSVDFVSMWGNWHSLNADKWADKNEVKRLKNTRVLMCFIVGNCGDQTTPAAVRANWKENGFSNEAAAVKDFWGWDDRDQEKIDAAIRKYAKSLVDTITKYDWDGFDFDYEANWGASGNIAGPQFKNVVDDWDGNPELNRDNRGNFLTFIKALGEHLGPKSGTGKMLVIDGEPQNMHPDARDYFDYYIIQAYYCTSYTDLDTRYNKLLRGLMAAGDREREESVTRKLIYCEDFEMAGYAANGGTTHVTRDGRRVRSLLGMALWQPLNGYVKGGVGSYHMEYDYTNNPEYKWLRQATGIMNPVIK